VNPLRLPSGAWSSQRHWHTRKDAFVYMIAGEVAQVTATGEVVLHAGDRAGFKRGDQDNLRRLAAAATSRALGLQSAREAVRQEELPMTRVEVSCAMLGIFRGMLPFPFRNNTCVQPGRASTAGRKIRRNAEHDTRHNSLGQPRLYAPAESRNHRLCCGTFRLAAGRHEVTSVPILAT